jgi:SRSO17 transposase
MALNMNQSSVGQPGENIDLAHFAQDVFASFLRSDQRRWGEIYLRGLVDVPGRRSIRRICDHVVGWRADQCLQQFLNQSPWEWEPVRRRLAQHVEAAIQPKAWVVEEAVFPKYGANSVGVEKQFAYPIGRTINCQLALTVVMAGEYGASPVNWRLLLPRSWDEDAARRDRAHVPDDVRYRPRWQHLLDAIDEMAAEWDLAPTPIVVDAHQQPQVEPLLSGLEERGLRYLVRVAAGMPIAARSPARRQSMTRLPTVGEIVAQSAGRHGMTLSWPGGPEGKLIRSQFVVALLPAGYETGSPPEIGPGRFNRRQRRAIAQWSPSRRRPKEIWLTNLNTSQLPEVIDLITQRRRAGEELSRLSEESGLRHFEGRSYRGWQHHVTLVSVAQAYELLSRLAAESLLAAEDETWHRVPLYA